MTNEELLRFSDSQHSVAEKILADTQLLDILSKHGICTIEGGMKYGLMYGPDIDLLVQTSNPRQASLTAIKELLDGRNFQKFQYGDFDKFPRPGRSGGIIIVLILMVDSVKWEIEIWFRKNMPNENSQISELVQSNLSPRRKLDILRLKQQREENGEDKHTVSSVDIYRAVIENGVSDFASLLELLNIE